MPTERSWERGGCRGPRGHMWRRKAALPRLACCEGPRHLLPPPTFAFRPSGSQSCTVFGNERVFTVSSASRPGTWREESRALAVYLSKGQIAERCLPRPLLGNMF